MQASEAPYIFLFRGKSVKSRFICGLLQLPELPRRRAPAPAAASSSSSSSSPSSSSGLSSNQLLYILGWYGFNIIFNIYNKSTLNVFPCPWFLSTVQLGCGVLFMAILWGARVYRVPKVTKEFLIAMVPVSLFHLLGHVSACVSFSQMAGMQSGRRVRPQG